MRVLQEAGELLLKKLQEILAKRVQAVLKDKDVHTLV